MDNRADNFRQYCISIGIEDFAFTSCPRETAQAVVAAWLDEVRDGRNPHGRTDLCGSTLGGYATAALCWANATPDNRNRNFIYEENSTKFCHAIAVRVNQRKQWEVPVPKFEPIPPQAYSELEYRYNYLAISAAGFTSRPAVAMRCIVLASFTGSRLGEYGQSKTSKAMPIARVPPSPYAPECAGSPLAFMRGDLTFWDKADVEVPITSPNLSSAFRLKVRFRFDKGPNNWEYRTWRRTMHPFFCPVRAAADLCRGAQLLRVPPLDPLAAYSTPGSTRLHFIVGDDIKETLGAAVTAAFPNEDHRVHQVLNKFSAHSLRVTPAMALLARGFTPDVVAFILRWNSDAIKRYMRDPRLTTHPLFLNIALACELISEKEFLRLSDEAK